MMKRGYFLACNAAVAFALAVSPLQAGGCGCGNKNNNNRRPKQDGKENAVVPKNVSFVEAGCPCTRKNPVPGSKVPGSKDKKSTNAALTLAGCPMRTKIKPLPAEQEMELYGQMALIAAENKLMIGGKDAPASPAFMQVQARDCYLGRKAIKFAPASHVIKENDPAGSIVGIEDESVFAVAEKDQAEVQKWDLNSLITVKPNRLSLWNKLTGSKPKYKYVLVNLSKKKSKPIQANLSMGPVKENPATRVISAIDTTTGKVILDNGTEWRVDMNGPCAKLVQGWKIGHSVISGTNDTWFSLGSPYILINVAKNNWIPATRAV